MMRSELLEVIKKYVHVDIDAININFEHDSGHEILELSVALPDGKPTTATKPAERIHGGAQLHKRGLTHYAITGHALR